MTVRQISFYKYHGAGNDFVMLDNRAGEYSNLTQENIAFLCDRHFGVGSDGLIMLESSYESDFFMRYFNSDGSESTMCGNGGRCIVLFAFHLGLIEKKTRFTAIDGQHEATLIDNEIIRLKMSNCKLPEKLNSTMFRINTGSPHLVIFTDRVGELDVKTLGKKWRYEKSISEDGVNVNFCEIVNNDVLIRTYERGVEDETLACGTGCVASAISAVVSEQISGNFPIHLQTKGGVLMVDFSMQDEIREIYLTGPAKKVFEGIAEIS
jgi:diaminopimelate epimerase